MIKRICLIGIGLLFITTNVFAKDLFWNSHGVVLIFSSKCPYCRVFAPVITASKDEVKYQLAAYSIDGHGLPEINSFRKAPAGLLKAAFPDGNVVYPATFIIENETLKLYPIGLGALNSNEFLERLSSLKEKIKRYEGGVYAA